MAARKKPDKPQPNPYQKRWYELEGAALANEVQNIAEGLWTAQSHRRARYVRNLELFEGVKLGTYGAEGYYRCDFNNRGEEDPSNLIRSACQSAAAEFFAKQKPKPQFLTSGANWSVRRKAKKLDKICEGIMSQRQGRWIDTWAFLFDAGMELCIQGTACIYVIANEEEQRIEEELVPCCELYADPAEGRDPQNLWRVWGMDEGRALAMFCEVKGDEEGNRRRRIAIHGAQAHDRTEKAGVFGKPRATRMVRAYSAWRLPLAKDKPGKAVIVIGGEVMAEEDWTAPAFPFVFGHWEPHRDGIWGFGIADEGARQAEQVGELDNRLYARAIINGGRRIFYQEGTVAKELLELNGPETAIPVERTATLMPTETQLPPFTDAEFQFRQAKVQGFWDSIGLSQVSAAARREQGVESAVAMRTLNDTKSGRQLPKAQTYERMPVDLGHQYIWRMRELEKRNPGFKVTWPGKTLLRELKFSDADPGDEKFLITCTPASALPSDLAGRLATAGELFAQQLISPQTYKQLLALPDLEQELDADGAEYEYIDELIDRYLDAEEGSWTAGDYESPDGMILDKNRALMRFSAAYFRARREKAPQFNVGLLRRYIQELDAQIKEAQALAAAAAQPGQAMPPQGVAGIAGVPAAPQQVAA